MTTNFPTSLDAFTNPSATDAMDSVTVPHASQHADLNDAVEALQAKVGVDGSAVTTSLDYILSNLLGNVTALHDTSSLTIANTSIVNVPFGAGTEVCDPSNWHSTTTNTDRIYPTIAGSYLVVGHANLETPTFPTSSRFYVSVTKNGVNYLNTNFTSPNYPSSMVGGVMNLNGTTDYVTLQLYQDSGSSKSSIRRNLFCMLLRPA